MSDPSAGLAVARLTRSLGVALSAVNLSIPQYRLLAFLSKGPERAAALARWLDVSPPSLTALVDGCVDRGLVERVASPSDRRLVVHVITAQGSDLLARGDAIASKRVEELSTRLPPSQARKMIEGLEELGRALDERSHRARKGDR